MILRGLREALFVLEEAKKEAAQCASTGSTGGTAVLMTATNAGQLTNTILNVVASGYTTGYTGNVVSITGCLSISLMNIASLSPSLFSFSKVCSSVNLIHTPSSNLLLVNLSTISAILWLNSFSIISIVHSESSIVSWSNDATITSVLQ